jgi:hypothetical protein
MLKIDHPDGHPPWSERAKPYMEITCSGRATVQTTLSYRPDAALKQDFQRNLRNYGLTVVRPDGPCSLSGLRPYIL